MISKWWIERCFKKRLWKKYKNGECSDVAVVVSDTEDTPTTFETNTIRIQFNIGAVEYKVSYTKIVFMGIMENYKVVVNKPDGFHHSMGCSESYFRKFQTNTPQRIADRAAEKERKDTRVIKTKEDLIELGKLP